MKEKIFERMREYGWNLYDNTDDDFYNVLNCHCFNLDAWHNYIHNEEFFTMEYISKSRFCDFVDFMNDFFKAFEEIEIENNNNNK